MHAIQLLESWHTTYMEVRSRIEDSGTDHRWEFDRKRLFEQVPHCSSIVNVCY
jgi:dynein heavy chain, axonemal